jgi:hypothetical protein
MKKVLFALLILISALITKISAQTDTLFLKKLNKLQTQSPCISVDAGLSIPTGDFASRSASGIASNTNGTITNFRGWATIGEAISLRGSIPICGKWGIGIGYKIGYNQTPFDIKTLTKYEFDPYSPSEVLINNDWKLCSFLAGISWSYYTHKISFETGIFVGELYSNSLNETSAQVYSGSLGYSYPSYDTIHFSSSKSNLFIAEAQVSFKYFFTHNIFCQLSVSYETSFSNFNYNGYGSSYYSGPIQPGYYNPSSYSVIYGSTPISTLDITLGVGYKFR